MTETSITPDIHKAFNIHRSFAAKVAFNYESGNLVTNLFQIGITQILNLLRIRNAASVANLARSRTTNAINSRQPDLCVLMRWDIDTSNTSHSF